MFGIWITVAVINIQMTFAILLTQISRFVSGDFPMFFISEMIATDELMINTIGMNLIGLTKIRVVEVVPGKVVTEVIIKILYDISAFERL